MIDRFERAIGTTEAAGILTYICAGISVQIPANAPDADDRALQTFNAMAPDGWDPDNE